MNHPITTLLGDCSRRFAAVMRHGAAVLLALCTGFALAQVPNAEPASAPPAARHLSDRWITAKVRAEILAVSVNQSAHVRVKTVRGAVTLTGTVVSQNIALQFAHAAQRPEGVKSVDASGLTVTAR